MSSLFILEYIALAYLSTFYQLIENLSLKSFQIRQIATNHLGDFI